MMQYPMFRIIDANRNRIGEGLRFLEDIARFIFDDNELTQHLKSLRHDLLKKLSVINENLFISRNAEQDIGYEPEQIDTKQDLYSLVTANAKRVEEALRVVEELAKHEELSPKLNARDFKKARFELYTIEQALYSKLGRRNRIERLSGLYVIIDTDIIGTGDEIDIATHAIRGGAGIIQIRDKRYHKKKLLDISQKLMDICYKSNALLIVNDHLDIALASGADGLHIGQDDFPLSVARKELPIDKIIGCSTHNLAQALKAHEEGADYIGVGSIFPTTTKENAEVIGLDTLQSISQKVTIPIVAIGGINKNNISSVFSSGASAAAVISAVLNVQDIESATKELVDEIEKEKTDR